MIYGNIAGLAGPFLGASKRARVVLLSRIQNLLPSAIGDSSTYRSGAGDTAWAQNGNLLVRAVQRFPRAPQAVAVANGHFKGPRGSRRARHSSAVGSARTDSTFLWWGQNVVERIEEFDGSMESFEVDSDAAVVTAG